MTSRGSRFCKETRKQYQLSVFKLPLAAVAFLMVSILTREICLFRIPGIVNRGNQGKPIMILVDPTAIFSLMTMPNSRFLGSRYFMVRFEIPFHSEMSAINDNLTPYFGIKRKSMDFPINSRSSLRISTLSPLDTSPGPSASRSGTPNTCLSPACLPTSTGNSSSPCSSTHPCKSRPNSARMEPTFTSASW